MRTLIIIILLAGLSGQTFGAEKVCAIKKKIAIKELYAPIHVNGEISRRDSIELLIKVSCKSGEVVSPDSLNDAVEMLDKALPLDFKVGAIRGKYLNLYTATNYGASVLEDLDNFFSNNWHLDAEQKKICRNFSEASLVEEGGCFYIVMDSLRNKYLGFSSTH